MRPDFRLLAVFCSALLGLASAAVGEDSRAVEIAERSMAAMGGAAAWQSTRLLHFDWAVERDGETVVRYQHWWDRETGNYRLEGTTRDGKALRVQFDVDSRSGEAWLDDEHLSGAAADEQVQNAYARFINDTYWLVMPWKWLDPGVVLTYEGEREVDGRRFDVVRLEFGDGIGLTSQDRYWGWIAKESGLMERWEYVLQDEQGQAGTDEPTVWKWDDWVETDTGVLLSAVKRRVGGEGDVRITFPFVETAADLTATEIESLFQSRE